MNSLAALLLAANLMAGETAPANTAVAVEKSPGAAKPPDMSKPPVVGPMKPYKLPPRQDWTLANGLEVVLVEDHKLPLVTARLAFRAGSAAIPEAHAGLAEAMAELLTDGTKNKNSKEISDAAEEYGGTISAEADADSLLIRSYALAEGAEKMIELLAEVVQSASYPSSEVSLRKQNMQEELTLNRAESDFLASVAFYKKVFKGHPYAITAPTDDSIAKLSRRLILMAHKSLITPRNAILVIVGDITGARARSIVEARFSAWKGKPGPAEAPAVAVMPEPRKVYLVDRPESVQASIFIGNVALREDHPDYFNLLLANQVLGGSFSSRLVQDIRETKGYTYRIGSRLEHRLTSTLFRVRTPVRTEVTVPALEAIFGHLKSLRETAVAPEELEKAKSFLAGSFARSMETQEGIAGAVLHTRLHRLPDNYYDLYVERIQNVSAAGALQAAANFIHPEDMPLVVVGEAAKLRDVLAKFSAHPVISVDRDGN